MGDYLIAGRPAFESIWRRTRNDAWAFIRTPLYTIAHLLLTAVVAISAWFITENIGIRIAAPSIALVGVLSVRIVVAVCLVAFAQRDEARKEAVRILGRLQPKLTLREVIVHHLPPDNSGTPPPLYAVAVRICVENDSAVMAERCTAQLLDTKPLVEWLPLVEGDRYIRCLGEFEGLPDIPGPVPLRWSASKAPNIDIQPLGESLFDVCYYDSESQYITLAFHLDDMQHRYPLRETDVVFSVRVDSKDCLPIYCVCKFRPRLPMSEINDQCVIKYNGPDRPDLKDYQQFEQTPRPSEWGEYARD